MNFDIKLRISKVPRLNRTDDKEASKNFSDLTHKVVDTKLECPFYCNRNFGPFSGLIAEGIKATDGRFKKSQKSSIIQFRFLDETMEKVWFYFDHSQEIGDTNKSILVTLCEIWTLYGYFFSI